MVHCGDLWPERAQSKQNCILNDQNIASPRWKERSIFHWMKIYVPCTHNHSFFVYHLSAHENTCTIALITILYLYNYTCQLHLDGFVRLFSLFVFSSHVMTVSAWSRGPSDRTCTVLQWWDATPRIRDIIWIWRGPDFPLIPNANAEVTTTCYKVWFFTKPPNKP